MSSTRLRLAFGILVSACAGPGVPTTLVRVMAEPVGAHCQAGGSRIESGADTNGDGTLEPTEVTDAQYVCSGATGPTGADGVAGDVGPRGADGLTGRDAPKVLVKFVSEPAGTNCENGGKRLLAGPDTNGNEVLDPSEVSVTSYVCDGAPGPGITWQSVTGATQAVSNTGYIANSASVRVVVTLPASPVVGDIIQVTGGAAGGFAIAQNAGQSIDARNLGVAPGTTWKTSLYNSQDFFGAVATSADGRRVLAVASSGSVNISTDSGATWTARRLPNAPFRLSKNSAASSANGMNLVVAESTGLVWLSNDGGTTWSMPSLASGLPTTAAWSSVAASSDGMKLVLTASGGQIWTSTNGGVTWLAHGGGSSGLPATSTWSAVASSADGVRLIAVGSEVYLSGNGGSIWRRLSTMEGLPSAFTSGVACSSADGLTLVVASATGPLWTSTDGGLSWLPSARTGNWVAVTSSADGVRLFAGSRATQGGYAADQFYASDNRGSTWVTRGVERFMWVSLSSSADGTRLFGGHGGNDVLGSTLDSTPGTSGGLTGVQGNSVSLQYLGAGVFTVLSASGAGFAIQ